MFKNKNNEIYNGKQNTNKDKDGYMIMQASTSKFNINN